MNFAFDLISDLHIETWDFFDWTDQATSPYCVVAGDVCNDRELLVKTLTHLGQCYPGGVFYIDGNDEHRYYLEDLGASYKDLYERINHIPNVVYLQDNVVIINGVAILGTNGWWTFDFDPDLDVDQSMQWFSDLTHTSMNATTAINSVAYHDAAYLANSIQKLQTHQEVQCVVVVSHTVPTPWLIQHDTELTHTWRFNTTGNKYMQRALKHDTENKVRLWCFGHYHRMVDQDHDGIRWVNNCRGRGDTDWCQVAFYPKRIEIEY
jgi:predicted phosphodiesterase